MADIRPTFAWLPLPGVQRYRVRLIARVQEGEITANIDTFVTGTTFVPPEPLTRFQADVRISVTEDCRSPGILDDVASRYRVDNSLACFIDQPAWNAASVTLTWPAATVATDFEVLVFVPPDARLLSREVVRGTAWRPTVPLPAGTVLAVLPNCGVGHGDVRLVQTSSD